MKIRFYTEEYLYDKDIKNVLRLIGVDENSDYDIVNIVSTNNSSLLDLLVEIDGVMEYGIEITQTTDKDSRNSSVYQRGQKFIQFRHYYPNAKCLMYYTETFVPTTDTAKFGFGLLYNMGVTLYNVVGDYPTDLTELIKLKNNMKTKGNNVPVRVNIYPDRIVLSAKLEKSGDFTHDPNIGFVSTICYLLRDYNLPIHIINHNLTKKHTESRNKLFQNLCTIDTELTFEFDEGNITWDCEVSKYTDADTYFTIKEDGEKVSMIKFCKLLDRTPGVEVIFRNIAGCEREKMRVGNNIVPVPKKVRIPDLVYLQGDKVMIVEGECDYNLKKGIKQLDTFDDFETFTETFLSECGVNVGSIKRGVITDKYVENRNPLYWGYFLSSTKRYFTTDEITL